MVALVQSDHGKNETSKSPRSFASQPGHILECRNAISGALAGGPIPCPAALGEPDFNPGIDNFLPQVPTLAQVPEYVSSSFFLKQTGAHCLAQV